MLMMMRLLDSSFKMAVQTVNLALSSRAGTLRSTRFKPHLLFRALCSMTTSWEVVSMPLAMSSKRSSRSSSFSMTGRPRSSVVALPSSGCSA